MEKDVVSFSKETSGSGGEGKGTRLRLKFRFLPVAFEMAMINSISDICQAERIKLERGVVVHWSCLTIGSPEIKTLWFIVFVNLLYLGRVASGDQQELTSAYHWEMVGMETWKIKGRVQLGEPLEILGWVLHFINMNKTRNMTQRWADSWKNQDGSEVEKGSIMGIAFIYMDRACTAKTLHLKIKEIMTPSVREI